MPVKNPHTKLTPAEEKAVRYVIENDGKQRDAALKAYPHIKKWKRASQDQFASKLFNKPLVKARINNVQAKAAHKTEVSAEYILGTIVETMERCKQAEPVLNTDGTPKMVKTKDGMMAPAYTFEPQSVLKGAEMLMKHKGLYELDNRQRDSLSRIMEKLGLKKLEALAAKLEKMVKQK